MPALALEVHTKVCRKCFKGDLVPGKTVSGYHRKTALTKTTYECTSCGHTKPGAWMYEHIDTYLDKIEDALTKLDDFRFGSQIADVQGRVTNFLSSGGLENALYLYTQYQYVCRLVKLQEETDEINMRAFA